MVIDQREGAWCGGLVSKRRGMAYDGMGEVFFQKLGVIPGLLLQPLHRPWAPLVLSRILPSLHPS